MTPKTFDKFLSAQEILSAIIDTDYRYLDSDTKQGFSLKINGASWSDFVSYKINQTGWNKAEEMIKDGRIFFVHPFKCSSTHCPTRFQYGGGWACNSCNTCIDTPESWKIKVMKDGNAWVCIGNGFTDLQSSNNYAFGDSFEEAIENYKTEIENL